MPADINSPSLSPLKKESIFLLALLLEILMSKNGFRDQSYTKEDINDTLESLSKYKLEWFSELSKKIKTEKSHWVRQNIFRITIQRTPEPVITIELSNFLRINYFNNFIKAFVELTGCKLLKTGKYSYVVSQ